MSNELSRARPEYARGLLQAIGAIDDGDAATVLIDRLESEDGRHARRCAVRLAPLTGMDLAPTPAVWRAWARQGTALAGEGPPAPARHAAEPRPGRVTAALREYGGRRMWRGSLVRRREQGARSDASPAAAHGLRSPGAARVAVLAARTVEPLAGRDPTVAAAAWQALRELSGKEIPKEPEHVRQMLNLD
jgi:hypothetical protein